MMQIVRDQIRKTGLKIVYLVVLIILSFLRYASGTSVFWGDVIMDKTEAEMTKKNIAMVLFSHQTHRLKYRCMACHSSDFEMEKGKSGINMTGMEKGKWCGKCHDGKITFSYQECNRCHFLTLNDRDQFNTMLKRNYPLVPSTAKEKASDNITEDDEKEPQNPFLEKVTINSSDQIYLNQTGELGSIGKPGSYASVAAKLGAQENLGLFKNLKRDRFGLIDWAASVDSDQMQLASSIKSPPEKYSFSAYKINGFSDKGTIASSEKTHGIHSYFVECRSCHPTPFAEKSGTTSMDMEKMATDKACGKCHGHVAFPLDDCGRCHISK
jgi:c(7)-type cytochrome triheme protein